MECGEQSLNTTPWTVGDAGSGAAVWLLSSHLIVFSLDMSGLPTMLVIFIVLQAKAAGWQSLGFRRLDGLYDQWVGFLGNEVGQGLGCMSEAAVQDGVAARKVR